MSTFCAWTFTTHGTRPPRTIPHARHRGQNQGWHTSRLFALDGTNLFKSRQLNVQPRRVTRLNPQPTMPTCNNCGANVPLKKSLSGRPLEKQDRDCPECGKTLGPEDDQNPNRLAK